MLSLTLILERLAILGIALVIIAALLAAALLIVRRPWWPSVVFQLGQRPWIFIDWLGGSFVALTMVLASLGGAAGMALATLLWLIAAPGVIGPIATKAAWKRDTAANPKADESAREVRNRVRRREMRAEVSEGDFWPEYLLDRWRAEMQARYRPPGD